MAVKIRRQVCDGYVFKGLFAAGLMWLQQHRNRVDALNVFPVPDGDTGKNMLLTMQSAYKAVEDLQESHVGIVTERIAKGALMGARGNSGVILSELLRGFASVLRGHEVFDAPLMAEACQAAVEAAYKAVQEPVEGTILTVAREAMEAIAEIAHTNNDLIHLLDVLIAAARIALEKTPDLLPVLKKAGVVDSGGQGLIYILEGMAKTLRGEAVCLNGEANAEANTDDDDTSRVDALRDALEPEDEAGYGYDVQFLMHGKNMDVAAIRAIIEAMGWSALVVGDDRLLKVHVHVHNPGEPLQYAISTGAWLDDVVVENMQAQYQGYLQARRFSQVTAAGVAVIAVASGGGFRDLFYGELGAARVISGGQTMNPSAADFIKAIESIGNKEIILLPNNGNIIMAAGQAAGMVESRSVRVIPTKTLPQGISAMLATLDQRDDGLESVAAAMLEALPHIITCEVTQATRDAEINGLNIKTGQFIGLVNGDLISTGEKLPAVITDSLQKAGAYEYELVTLYYGEGETAQNAEALVAELETTFPDLTFQIIRGDQPLYPYIISVE